jgi:hypothetical protein
MQKSFSMKKLSSTNQSSLDSSRSTKSLQISRQPSGLSQKFNFTLMFKRLYLKLLSGQKFTQIAVQLQKSSSKPTNEIVLAKNVVIDQALDFVNG